MYVLEMHSGFSTSAEGDVFVQCLRDVLNSILFLDRRFWYD